MNSGHIRDYVLTQTSIPVDPKFYERMRGNKDRSTSGSGHLPEPKYPAGSKIVRLDPRTVVFVTPKKGKTVAKRIRELRKDHPGLHIIGPVWRRKK